MIIKKLRELSNIHTLELMAKCLVCRKYTEKNNMSIPYRNCITKNTLKKDKERKETHKK